VKSPAESAIRAEVPNQTLLVAANFAQPGKVKVSITLGQLALQIARRDLRAAGIAVRQSNVQSMFTNELGVNTASTVVQRISAVCEAALRERPAI
jgi:hypothetical protein